MFWEWQWLLKDSVWFLQAHILRTSTVKVKMLQISETTFKRSFICTKLKWVKNYNKLIWVLKNPKVGYCIMCLFSPEIFINMSFCKMIYLPLVLVTMNFRKCMYFTDQLLWLLLIYLDRTLWNKTWFCWLAIWNVFLTKFSSHSFNHNMQDHSVIQVIYFRNLTLYVLVQNQSKHSEKISVVLETWTK